jgi:hypothetical protein
MNEMSDLHDKYITITGKHEVGHELKEETDAKKILDMYT